MGLLILSAGLPYINTLFNGFLLTYDDRVQILENPYVHSFRYLKRIFGANVWSYVASEFATNYYRPAMTFGFLLCYKIFGPVAYGFHLVNVMLHSAVVVMVFYVSRRMGMDRGFAFGAAALFALHPIHTEPVAWVSGVTELEVTLFGLLTFWLFLGVARPGGKCSELRKLGMVGSYLLALLSKEQALTLPPLGMVYEHFYREDRAETTWVQKLSRYGVLWMLGAAYILIRTRILGGFAPVSQRPGLGWRQVSFAAIALIGQYLWKLLWPVRLSMYYLFPENVIALLPCFVGGLVALIACAALFAVLWKGNRLASFGLVWLFVTLAPVLNARWMGGNVFAERYLYLPSIGFCWLVAWELARRWQIASRRKAVWHSAIATAAGLISLLCFYRIVTRNRDWRSDVALYTRTLAVSPDAYVVRSALGLAYWGQGNLEAAEREWQSVLRVAPADASTWNYLGGVYARRKEFVRAVDCFDRAIKLRPAYPEAHLAMGSAFAEQGMVGPAERQFRAAVALSPLNFQAHNVLGKLYLDSGRFSEAEEQFRQSVESEPNVAGFDYLGELYLSRRDGERAQGAFRGALSVYSSDSRAHFNLGAIYAETGRNEEAIREYQAGLDTDPGNDRALAALQKLKRQAPHSTPSHP